MHCKYSPRDRIYLTNCVNCYIARDLYSDLSFFLLYHPPSIASNLPGASFFFLRHHLHCGWQLRSAAAHGTLRDISSPGTDLCNPPSPPCNASNTMHCSVLLFRVGICCKLQCNNAFSCNALLIISFFSPGTKLGNPSPPPCNASDTISPFCYPPFLL